MGEVVTAGAKGVARSAEMHELDRDIGVFIEAYDAADGDHEGPRARLALAQIDKVAGLATVLDTSISAISRPASRKEIARELTLIVASKPEEWNRATSETGDTRSSLREMWTQLFIEEVEALRPSIGGLRLAGKRLRGVKSDNDYANRRLPPICDVVQTVKNAEARFSRARRRLAELPALRGRLQKAADYEAARQARYQQKTGPINSKES